MWLFTQRTLRACMPSLEPLHYCLWSAWYLSLTLCYSHENVDSMQHLYLMFPSSWCSLLNKTISEVWLHLVEPTPELEAGDRPWTWWGRPDTPIFWPVVAAATSGSCPQGVFRTQVNTLRGYSRAPSPLNPLLASPCWEVDIITLIWQTRKLRWKGD